MAQVEQSFPDRYTRGITLHSVISAMPGYLPSEGDITVDGFGIFLGTVATQDGLVGSKASEYSNIVTHRQDLYFGPTGLKRRVSKIYNYCKSLTTIPNDMKYITRVVHEVRNYAAPKKSTKPVDPSNAEQVKKREKGNQSFGDLHMSFKELLQVVESIPSYSPQSDDIKAMALDTLETNIDLANKGVNRVEKELDKLIIIRKDLYDGPTGLREKMKRIKAHIASNYGLDSAEYQLVKGIRV